MSRVKGARPYVFKKRSRVRLMLGKTFFKAKRYLEWYFGKKKYATKRCSTLLPVTVYSHRTPLIRNLRGVDMWLQYNKIRNLSIAVGRLDKVVVNPGETFSFWRIIGKPARRKGYVEGMVLSNGSFYPGVGGGLCQLSNLIYWMTLHTPLTVTERYRHTHDVFPDSDRTQPFGSGATCVYNYIDLQIRNDTDQAYQLHVYLTSEHLAGEWRAEKMPDRHYEVYQKEHWITHEFWGGYMRHNTIFRKVFDKDGIQVDDEFITENHAIMMYEPMLEQSTSEDSK